MVKNLSEVAEKRLVEIIGKYPEKRSAIMPALYIAQEELGFISEEAVNWVATRLGLPPIQVMEIATFYTMYFKTPVGKYHVQVCRTLSCALCGAKSLTEYLSKRLGIVPGQVTPDGFWSLEEVECLGSCGTAPMCQINDVFFENLSVDDLARVLDRIEKEKPDLKYSTVNDSIGVGLNGRPLSEIV